MRLPRGGLDETDRGYIGMNFDSSAPNVAMGMGGLICCKRN